MLVTNLSCLPFRLLSPAQVRARSPLYHTAQVRQTSVELVGPEIPRCLAHRRTTAVSSSPDQ